MNDTILSGDANASPANNEALRAAVEEGARPEAAGEGAGDDGDGYLKGQRYKEQKE